MGRPLLICEFLGEFLAGASRFALGGAVMEAVPLSHGRAWLREIRTLDLAEEGSLFPGIRLQFGPAFDEG